MRLRFSLFLIALLLPTTGTGQGNPGFTGKWTFIQQMSDDIGLYASLSMEFRQSGSNIVILQKWGAGRSFLDSLSLEVGGKLNKVPITHRVFPTNVFMGLSMPVGGTRLIKATWENDGKVLRLDESYSIRGSQGMSPISAIHTFELSNDGELLTYIITRSTRPSGFPVKFVLKRAGLKDAYVMRLENNWEIQGKLSTQAFLISLQGLANSDAPRFYFVYPPGWDFTYTQDVFDFFKNKRNFTFTELPNAEAALQVFKKYVKGYVVWDKSVRTSLTRFAGAACGPPRRYFNL